MQRTKTTLKNERRTLVGIWTRRHLFQCLRYSNVLVLILVIFSLGMWVSNDDLRFELSDTTGSFYGRNLLVNESTADNTDEQLLLIVSEWVKGNGGYINDKVDIRRINNYLTGMIATKDMGKGETICKIPKNLILNPNNATGTTSLRGSKPKCKRINYIHEIITKDQNLQNPYERYLASRTAKAHHHLPLFWTSNAKELLEQLLGQTWGRDRYNEDLENLRKNCWPDKYKSVNEMDERILDAIAIAIVRYESGNNFIPWYDVINHANGPDWTADNRHHRDDGSFELFTTRKVHAGEQLALSYDQQSTGYGDNYDSVDYLFGYGFVPTLPQKWILNLGQGRSSRLLKFTIDYMDQRAEKNDDESSEFKLIFHDGTERKASISDIQKELERLRKFDLQKAGMMDSIPENEKHMIRQFHSSAITALNQILRHLDGTYKSVNTVSSSVATKP